QTAVRVPVHPKRQLPQVRPDREPESTPQLPRQDHIRQISQIMCTCSPCSPAQSIIRHHIAFPSSTVRQNRIITTAS
ncbi:hypothetical protein ASPCADRAFT_205559, partial [Aspergillus carbonarius ITEM 5010]